MRATFNGTVLSTDSFAPGETWLTTFRIQGQQQNQVSKPTRAEYVTLYARAARMHSIEIVFRPPPEADFDAAAEALCLYFAELPQQGDLVLLSGVRERTFPNACLESFTPPPRRGVSNEWPVKFIAGAVTTRTRSRLGTMNINAIANLYDITGLTGGGSTKLDGLVTTDVAAGFQLEIFAAIGALNQLATFRLYAGTDAANTDPDAGPVIVRPADYNASTNAKVWKRLDA